MKNAKYGLLIVGGIVVVSLVVYLLGDVLTSTNSQKSGLKTSMPVSDNSSSMTGAESVDYEYTDVGDPTINFSYFGVIQKEGDNLLFVYTSADGSDETASLVLNQNSMCDFGSGSAACQEADLQDGMNANIDGAQNGAVVTVSSLMVVQI